eukprot:15791069-Heterocapsa_arctica.AAC.1
MFSQECNHLRFVPIFAAAGPLNKDRGPTLDSRRSNLFEGIPKTSEKLPVSQDLLHSVRTTRHVVVLPRATSRARAREPETRSKAPKIVRADDFCLLGGEVDLLSD